MEKIDRLPYSKINLNLILETLADDVKNADLPVFKLTLKNSEIICGDIVKIKNILRENSLGGLVFVMFREIIKNDELNEINFKGLIEKINSHIYKKDFKEIHDLIKNYINDPKNKNRIKAKRLNILKELNEFGELLYFLKP